MALPVQSVPPQDMAVYVGGTVGAGAGATASAWLPLINSVLGLILLSLSIIAMALTILSRWRLRRDGKK